MTEWDVQGYEVEELLGFGSSGEVWRARERVSGKRVALRRLAGGDRAAVTAVKAQATVVRSLASPHVIRLRTTTRAGRDDVLVMDFAAGGSLASLLLRRGRLEPGEVVTTVAPLAEGLGQAHAHGLVHGRLGASSVLLSAQGMPLLDGLGVAALYDAEDSLDPTGGLGAAADVWALGALAHLLLTGEQPGTTILATLAPRAPLPLVRAIEAALGFDPTTRPSAADLAAALLAACPPLPIEGITPVAEPSRAPARFPRPTGVSKRRALVGAAVVLVLAAVSALGWVWGTQSGDRATRIAAGTTTATTTASVPAHASVVHPPLQVPGVDWTAVLGQLDAARADAFAHADAQRLEDVYAPGAAGLVVDRAAVAGLVRLRRTALGVEHEIGSVTVLGATRDRAELRVTEALGAFELLDGAGRVLEEHVAGSPTGHDVVLVSTRSGWRIKAVSLT